MNEIIKHNTGALALTQPNVQALATLPRGEQKIIKAALQPKVNELPGETVESELVTIIATVITIAGQKADDATTAIFAGELYEKLLEDLPLVSIEEIKTALRNGVYGEYGEFYGLNPKTFYNFIKSYLFSEERKAARVQFESKRLQIAQAVELTPEQRRGHVVTFTETLYKDYCAGSLLTDYIPTFIYDLLEAEQLLRLSIEEKRVINDRAKSYYLRFQASPKTRGGGAKPIGAHLAGYLHSDPDKTVITISKQFAVFDYFERCKAQGKTVIFEPLKMLDNGNEQTDNIT